MLYWDYKKKRKDTSEKNRYEKEREENKMMRKELTMKELEQITGGFIDWILIKITHTIGPIRSRDDEERCKKVINNQEDNTCMEKLKRIAN